MTHSQWALAIAAAVLVFAAIYYAVHDAIAPMLWAVAAVLVIVAFIIR